MLCLKGLRVNYGMIQAVKGIDLEVYSGEIVALIGANGAGKSSTLQALTGSIKTAGGKIEFDGKKLNGLNPDEIVKRGVALVPEGRKIFGNLTVLENLELGGFTRSKKDNEEKLKELFKDFPFLKERAGQLGGTLSGGEQQMLSIGRAIMSRPKLLLLDEPSMGLSPLVEQAVFKVISQINKTGVSVLLVEQNANLALRISSRAYVMETGGIKLYGKSSDLLQNKEVRKAYLGED